MNRTLVITIGTIVSLLIFGGISLVGINSQRTATDGSTSSNTAPNQNAISEADVALVITYTGTGFEPSNSDIDANNYIRVRNRSIRVLQFVSDPYTTHSDNPELNIGEILPGESRTIYLTQQGRWKYHNALDPTQVGSLTVR